MPSTRGWQSRGKSLTLSSVAYLLRAGGEEAALRARAGMDIAGDDVLRVVEDRARVVREHELDLGAAGADQIAVELDVVHAGERVLFITEQLAVLLKRQHVAHGIDALLVQQILVEEMVAHLVGGVAELQHDLLRAHRDAAQADREAVAAQDREHDADGAAAELGADVRRDVLHGGVVALRAGHDGLGHGDHVAVAHGKAEAVLRRRGLQHAVDHDLSQIVALADDRRADASGNSTYHSIHEEHLFRVSLTEELYTHFLWM